MKKILLFIFYSASISVASAQILGNLVSIVPDSAMQGQTLITTITEQPGSFLMASPPCSNLDVYLVNGNYTIVSNYINVFTMDQVDAELSIDAGAPIGYYDVYVGAGHFDLWTGNCINQGWWVLSGGFQVTGPTGLKDPDNSVAKPFVYRNPFTGAATLSFSNPGGKKFNLSVLDSYGRLVYKTITDGDHAELNRQNLKPGIYFFRLEGIENQILYNGKFIIPE